MQMEANVVTLVLPGTTGRCVKSKKIVVQYIMAASRKNTRKSQRKFNKTAKKRHVHSGGAVCPSCNGAGGFTQTSTCGKCNGQGGWWEGKLWQGCRTCNRTGVLSYDVTCNNCGGTGQIPDKAPNRRRRQSGTGET